MRLFRMLNVVNVQCCGYYDDYPMHVFNIVIALMVQRRRFGANISMDVFAIENVTTMQRRVYSDDFPMNVLNIVATLMVQRRRFGANISMDVFAIENVTTMQRRRFGANISMDVFAIANVVTIQRCGIYANMPMDVSSIMNAPMVQRRRCCVFDSPGLARNEPTPGKHPQGDSTPSVLSFFYESMVITRRFMVGNVEKAQHLRRCSP